MSIVEIRKYQYIHKKNIKYHQTIRNIIINIWGSIPLI
jgi:hypothetical protein